MWKDLLNLVYVRDCYGCGEVLNEQERYICFDCLGQMEMTHFQEKPKDNELYYRFAGKVPIEGAAALFYFDKKGRLQKILQALKYHDAPFIGNMLGYLLGERLKGTAFGAAEVIMPVPLHPSRMRERGYNQSLKIAEGVQEVLGIPIEENCLVRTAKTLTQTRKSKSERWENVSSAFGVKQPTKAQRILLIDDVITTGSTLEACIRTLQAQQNAVPEIYVACVGIARA